VHIHEDLSHYDGGINHNQQTDHGVQRRTSAFQKTRRPTPASTENLEFRLYAVEEFKYCNNRSVFLNKKVLLEDTLH